MKSECLKSFGHEDFDTTLTRGGRWTRCPLTGCSSKLQITPYRKSELPYCPVHGIRLHTGTFVYWNGPDPEDNRRARLRNFQIRPDLAETVALKSAGKAETHRLGYELSEDALTWNVFVGLAEASALRDAVRALTNIETKREPCLYLWGHRVDLDGGQPESYGPLEEVRRRLEKDIGRYKTEPDVMLVDEGRLVVCIEAKFTSGNTLAHPGPTKPREKPIDTAGLLARYLNKAGCGEATRRSIDCNMIGGRFHSQLLRNIVFASEMGPNGHWRVVNLVSQTQWRKHGNETMKCSFESPIHDVRKYLAPAQRDKFTHETWEELYRRVICEDSRLSRVGAYLRSKSAHFERAFDLD